MFGGDGFECLSEEHCPYDGKELGKSWVAVQCLGEQRNDVCLKELFGTGHSARRAGDVSMDAVAKNMDSGILKAEMLAIVVQLFEFRDDPDPVSGVC
jgi:hypothetical protein